MPTKHQIKKIMGIKREQFLPMNSEEVSRKNADTLESSKFVKRDVLTSRRLLSFGRRHTQTHSEMALQLLSV